MKEEQRGSFPVRQNDWHPASRHASARVVIFLGEVQPRACPALQETPFGSAFAAAIAQRAPVQAAAGSVCPLHFIYPWIISRVRLVNV